MVANKRTANKKRRKPCCFSVCQKRSVGSTEIRQEFYPVVLVVTAEARSGPEYDFDGKIGMRPVGMRYEPRYFSKNHRENDMYSKYKALDTDKFHEGIVEHVTHPIRRKVHWAREDTLRMDNAPQHCGMEACRDDLNDGRLQR